MFIIFPSRFNKESFNRKFTYLKNQKDGMQQSSGFPEENHFGRFRRSLDPRDQDIARLRDVPRDFIMA